MASPIHSGAAWDLFQEFVRGGFSRIEKACTTNEPETALLDFKRNRDVHGPQPVLTTDGRAILGQCLSGFANTTGGSIVWGVSSTDRAANSLEPIPNIDLFVQSLYTHTGGAVYPPIVGVEHLLIEHPSGNGSGFAVTFVPDSLSKPHQCTVAHRLTTYYMRVGSNTEPMPHVYVQALMLAKARPELALIARVSRVEHGVMEQVRHSQLPVTIDRPTFYATLEFSVANVGATWAEGVSIAVEELPGLQIKFGTSTQIRCRTPSNEFQAWLSRPNVIADLYPGTSMAVGVFRFKFSRVIGGAGGLEPAEPLSIRWAAYARDYTTSDTLVVPAQDMVVN